MGKILLTQASIRVQRRLQYLATQIGATYTVRVERTTGSTSYTNRDNPVSSTTPALDAAEDTKPTFRTQGLRAEETSAAPFRPAAYRITIVGPAHHQLDVSQTSSGIRNILGLAPGFYPFDVQGEIQRDSRTRGTCSVSILQAPRRFNISLQNNSFTVNDVTTATASNIVTFTVPSTNTRACGLENGEVVNVRVGNSVGRAVVTRDANDDDFTFRLSMSSVYTGITGSTPTVTRLDGNRAKFDVSGYPLYQLLSPAPLVGLGATTVITGSTLLPKPFSAFNPSYIMRLQATADGGEPRSNPLPVTVTEGKKSYNMPYGFVRGGTSLLGGSLVFPSP